jgi:hypothetical protein
MAEDPNRPFSSVVRVGVSFVTLPPGRLAGDPFPHELFKPGRDPFEHVEKRVTE